MVKRFYIASDVVCKPLGPGAIDITGQRFHRLEVLGYAGSRHWFCRCTCGNITKVTRQNLRHTKSCGCFHKENISRLSKTHGLRDTPEYSSYAHALQRCTNKKDKDYARYGGRGIQFQFDSFEHFLQCVGFKPGPAYWIERIDNNDHYRPGNVRWSTAKDQCNNRSSNRMVHAKGRALNVTQWSKETGIPAAAIHTRLHRKWCGECAISIPLNGTPCPHR